MILLFITIVIVKIIITESSVPPIPHHPPLLPESYKDIFIAGSDGKITLGTTKSTCWARGGICTDIRDCPEIKIDISVAGCSWGYKVCCKIYYFGPPTVGKNRKNSATKEVRDIDGLDGVSLESVAEKNSLILKLVFGL